MGKSPFKDIGLPQIIWQGGTCCFVRRTFDRGNIFRYQFIGNPDGTYQWVYNSANAVKFKTRKAAEVALAACLLSS